MFKKFLSKIIDPIADLNSQDRETRDSAMAEFEDQDVGAIKDLIRALGLPINGFERGVAGAAKMFGDPDRGMVDENARARRAAADLLGALGPDAKNALPALRDALGQTPDKMTRQKIRNAIQRVLGEPIVDPKKARRAHADKKPKKPSKFAGVGERLKKRKKR